MAKISNYSKVKDMKWRHDKKDVTVRLSELPPGYHVKVNHATAGQYGTKKMARKKAVKWMREHPDPSVTNPTGRQ